MRYLGTLVFFFILSCSYAQKEANVWYFGNKAGLDFNSGTAVVLEDGALDSFEGVSTICDTDGNLLFYTDGITVYNKNHTIMQNGTGLLGHPSATQSGVIVPVPLSSTLFYIFTVDYAYTTGSLHYSIVDISLNGGLGAVTTKNVYIQDNSTEKISAVVHSNMSDIWIVIHERNNSVYKSYLLTKDGLSATIKTSNTGPIVGYNGEQGCLKISPDGNLLAMATYLNNRVDISTFDNTSGQITYSYGFNYSDATYGIEFSKDSKLLYVSVAYDISEIYQVNLDNHTSTRIATPAKLPGALQIGPDGKIYVARYMRPNLETKYLGVINYPEVIGIGCNYVDEAIYLGTGASKAGLPTFIQSFFDYTLSIEGTNCCEGGTSQFNAYLSADLQANLDWMSWDFGDPGSPDNTSALPAPIHVYENPGIYTVTFTMSANGNLLTKTTVINVRANPPLDLPEISYLCPDENLVLYAGAGQYSYTWSNAGTSSSITVSTAGEYWVEKTDPFGCISRDTTAVEVASNPELLLPDTLKICSGDTATIDAGAGQYTFLWNDASIGQQLRAFHEGAYWVRKTNTSGCSSIDTTNISLYAVPELTLGADSSLCDDGGILLQVSGFDTYTWQDNSHGSSYLVTVPGTYSVEGVTINNCSVSDEILITPCCRFSLLIPNAFTPNEDGYNDTFRPLINGANQCKMTIANRWGAIVFTTLDMDKGWDGRFENTDCPEGVYIVVLEFNRCDRIESSLIDTKIGAVTLIR